MPLHEASVQSPSVVDLLLEAGAEVNRSDTTGATPLHWAARCSLDCVMALLSRGANPLVKAQDNTTPTDLAAADSEIKARLAAAGDAVLSGQQGQLAGSAASALAAAQKVYPHVATEADAQGGLSAGLIGLLREAVRFYAAQGFAEVALSLEQVRTSSTQPRTMCTAPCDLLLLAPHPLNPHAPTRSAAGDE